jgi:hypothetical protein
MRAEFALTLRYPASHLPAQTAVRSSTFTIFEGTSEIQRLIIGTCTGSLIRSADAGDGQQSEREMPLDPT